jgi:hypothetical protein
MRARIIALVGMSLMMISPASAAEINWSEITAVIPILDNQFLIYVSSFNLLHLKKYHPLSNLIKYQKD